MSDRHTVRNLLVVSNPAPWIPASGQRLRSWILSVERPNSLEEAARLDCSRPWDVVAFRVESLPPLDPPEAMDALRKLAPEATFLPVSGRPALEEALYYLKHGAFEYLEEPLAPDEFLRALAEAIENREAFREILQLNRTLESQKEELLHEKKDLERKNRELQAVSQLARALAGTLDMEEVLATLARAIRENLGFQRILLGLVDPREQWEEIKIAQAPDHGLEDMGQLRWSLTDTDRNPWVKRVIHEQTPLTIETPESHPQTRGSPLAEVHRSPFAKLPMVARGRVVGTITVEVQGGEAGFDPESMGLLQIFADTTAMAVENARLYQTMRELSVRDELTGLYNRRHFLAQLEAEWNHTTRHDMPLSLLMIDIDHFKHLNDGNDHLTGDAALRKLSGLLLRNTRGIDTVARFGGEEFVVLLPRTPQGAARVVGEKLRSIVERTSFDGEEATPAGRLTISVGIATYPEDASGPRQLMERSDGALYEAKKKGRNRVCGGYADRKAEAG